MKKKSWFLKEKSLKKLKGKYPISFFVISVLIIGYFGIPKVLGAFDPSVSSWRGIYNQAALIMNKVQPNDIQEMVTKDNIEIENCRFNPDEWTTGQGNLVIDDPELNKYVVTSDSKSSTQLYERSISSQSTIRFIFTPLTEEFINVIVLFHDFYEIVIGDGDRRSVTAKDVNQNYLFTEQGDGKIVISNNLPVGKDVDVTITQKPLNSDTQRVLIDIKYFDGIDKKHKRESGVFEIPIPDSFKNTDKSIRVSTGILNTQETIDTAAQFKCFKVSIIKKDETISYMK